MSRSKLSRPLYVCITGSSSGIGLEAARQLLERNKTSVEQQQEQDQRDTSGNDKSQEIVIYHACRTMKRAKDAMAACNGQGIPLECDLADFDSIRNFAQQFTASTKEKERLPLDVLVLNAAVAPYSKATQPQLTQQGLEECMGVNHIGHFLLAQWLYPILKPNGRIVVVASAVHDPNSPGGRSGGRGGATLGDLSGLGVDLRPSQQQSNDDNQETRPNVPCMPDGNVVYNGSKIYKDSKLANILFVRHAAQVAMPDTTWYSCSPGFVPTTGLFRQQPWLLQNALWIMAKVFGWSVPVQTAAERIAYLVMYPNDKGDIPNGSYWCPSSPEATSYETGFVPKQVSDEAANTELAAKLWSKTTDIVQEWLPPSK